MTTPPNLHEKQWRCCGFCRKTELFGKSFEHFIFIELRAWLDYTGDRRPLTFWRDYAAHEVDFIIDDEIAIEVKSTEVRVKRKIVVSMDPAPRMLGDVAVLPWREFLTRMWGGAYTAV